MSTKKWLIPGISLMLFAFLVLPALGGCAKQAVPETQTKGEIIIGILDDFAGPLASICTEQTAGRQDAIRYINEEKDGILGHPVRVIVIDHKMDSTLLISGWDRMKAEDVLVDISTSAAAIPLLQSKCQTDRLPVVSGGGTMNLFFPREQSFYFITIPQYYGTFEALGDMIQKDWVKTGEKRKPKVNFDVISLGSYQKIYTKCSTMVAEKNGFDYQITYTSIAPADVTTQVLQAKNFGCDYLYMMTPETGVIPWLKELDRQNFRPKLFGSTSLAAAEVWNAAGKLCIGATAYQNGPQWTETDIPMVKLAHELNAKWHPEVKSHASHYIRGFSDITVVAEAVKRAIEKVGFDQLNGDAMQAAMETINNFDPGNNVAYTWTANDHQGVHGCWWYTWTDQGTLARASDWYEFAPLTEEQKTDAWWLQ